MEYRTLESGDEVDGHIIEDFGEPRAINDRFIILFALLRDGTYGIVVIEDDGTPLPNFKMWETTNERLKFALETSVEFPIAAAGAPGEIRVWGKDAVGNFTAVLYYGDARKRGMVDSFNYT